LSFLAFEPIEAHFKCLHVFNDNGVVAKSFQESDIHIVDPGTQQSNT